MDFIFKNFRLIMFLDIIKNVQNICDTFLLDLEEFATKDQVLERLQNIASKLKVVESRSIQNLSACHGAISDIDPLVQPN